MDSASSTRRRSPGPSTRASEWPSPFTAHYIIQYSPPPLPNLSQFHVRPLLPPWQSNNVAHRSHRPWVTSPQISFNGEFSHSVNSVHEKKFLGWAWSWLGSWRFTTRQVWSSLPSSGWQFMFPKNGMVSFTTTTSPRSCQTPSNISKGRQHLVWFVQDICVLYIEFEDCFDVPCRRLRRYLRD